MLRYFGFFLFWSLFGLGGLGCQSRSMRFPAWYLEKNPVDFPAQQFFVAFSSATNPDAALDKAEIGVRLEIEKWIAKAILPSSVPLVLSKTILNEIEVSSFIAWESNPTKQWIGLAYVKKSDLSITLLKHRKEVILQCQELHTRATSPRLEENFSFSIDFSSLVLGHLIEQASLWEKLLASLGGSFDSLACTPADATPRVQAAEWLTQIQLQEAFWREDGEEPSRHNLGIRAMSSEEKSPKPVSQLPVCLNTKPPLSAPRLDLCGKTNEFGIFSAFIYDPNFFIADDRLDLVLPLDDYLKGYVAGISPSLDQVIQTLRGVRINWTSSDGLHTKKKKVLLFGYQKQSGMVVELPPPKPTIRDRLQSARLEVEFLPPTFCQGSFKPTSDCTQSLVGQGEYLLQLVLENTVETINPTLFIADGFGDFQLRDNATGRIVIRDQIHLTGAGIQKDAALARLLGNIVNSILERVVEKLGTPNHNP